MLRHLHIVTSLQQLRWLEYALEENYWAHVEMFPATASQYSMTALNELHDILLNARAGKLRYIGVLP